MDFVEDEDFRNWVTSMDKTQELFWRTYLANYPEQKSIVAEAKQLLLSMDAYFEEEVSRVGMPDDIFLDKLESSFNTPQVVKRSNPIKKRQNWKLYLQGAAAAILVFLCFNQFAPINGDTQSFDKIEYATGNGEWEIITLPDGSKVELNANSQLSIFNEWEEGEDRAVWLKGEAFFEVEKKLETGAKFFVVTKDLNVEVLGTVFNVNTRNEHTEVFLEEGKIVLNLDDKKEEVEPGEFISYSQQQKKILTRYKKTNDIHSNWKDGVMKIEDAKMNKIIKELETIYGIDMIVHDDKVLEREGSVAVPVDDLEMTILILERILDIRVTSEGKQYYIN